MGHKGPAIKGLGASGPLRSRTQIKSNVYVTWDLKFKFYFRIYDSTLTVFSS